MGTCPSDVLKRLPITEVVKRYGYEPDRAGFIRCPFHPDRTPSLKLYTENNRWWCFGCCQGGSTIDFVMNLFDISFMKAVERMNSDFNLGLSWEKADPEALLQSREEKRRKELEDLLWERIYWNKLRDYQRLQEAMKAGPEDPEFDRACRSLPELEYWFEENPYGKDRTKRNIW